MGSAAGPGEIFDTNSLMLAARCRQLGAVPVVSAVQPDDPDALAAEIRRAALGADLVLVIAGSSRGRDDHAGAVLAQVGGVAVAGVAVRPGHPALLGHAKRLPGGIAPVIGLPGYPLATAVIFELFAAPLLAAIAGLRQPTAPACWRRLTGTGDPRRGIEDWALVTLAPGDGRPARRPRLPRRQPPHRPFPHRLFRLILPRLRHLPGRLLRRLRPLLLRLRRLFRRLRWLLRRLRRLFLRLRRLFRRLRWLLRRLRWLLRRFFLRFFRRFFRRPARCPSPRRPGAAPGRSASLPAPTPGGRSHPIWCLSPQARSSRSCPSPTAPGDTTPVWRATITEASCALRPRRSACSVHSSLSLIKLTVRPRSIHAPCAHAASTRLAVIPFAFAQSRRLLCGHGEHTTPDPPQRPGPGLG